MNRRVIPYARRIGASYYQARSTIRANWMLNNKRWIQKQMRDGKRIVDIGPDIARREGRGPSEFYEMERAQIHKKSYLHYERVLLS